MTLGHRNFRLINNLPLVDWKGIVSNGDDFKLIAEQWTKMFSLIREKHAPVRNKRFSEKFSPWVTKDLKHLSATRDRLKKQAVSSKSKILMEAYRQTRNKVNNLNTDCSESFSLIKLLRTRVI